MYLFFSGLVARKSKIKLLTDSISGEVLSLVHIQPFFFFFLFSVSSHAKELSELSDVSL